MEIGTKLKNARNNANLTQEDIAEKIGVSRQTVSNWENNKSYPDIISVIRLSDIYGISLDTLLKEDENMIKHLDESTNIVKSKNRLRKLLPVLAYTVIWALCVLLFWLYSGRDAGTYSIFVFWGILPVSTLIISAISGKEDFKPLLKIGIVGFLSVMYMLCDYLTFSLLNMVSFDKFNLPSLDSFTMGVIFSAVGMAIGSLVLFVKNKKANK